MDEKNHLLSPKHGLNALTKHKLSSASGISIKSCLGLLWRIEEEKEKIQREIILTGEPLKDKVKLLKTIKGIASMVAQVFLADVGDIKRFSSLRKMNAYLGLVPKAKDSGGRSKPGHINRESRKLSRTFLTQSVHHIAKSSPYLEKYYIELIERRGTGRARIALIRKICEIMRRMLVTGECYRWMNVELFQRKVKLYEKRLEKVKPERKVA